MEPKRAVQCAYHLPVPKPKMQKAEQTLLVGVDQPVYWCPGPQAPRYLPCEPQSLTSP